MSSELERFVHGLGLNSQTEVALGILYYSEQVSHVRQLAPSTIREAFEQAGQTLPSNVSQILSRLRNDRLVRKTGDGGYSLTTPGRRWIATRAEQAGVTPGHEVVVTVREISQALQEKVIQIADLDERRYAEEAIRCLHPPVIAYRAAVLMGWTAVIYHLRRKIEGIGFADFDRALRQLYPHSRRKPPAHFDDLEEYRDAELLEVCQRLRLYDKAVKKQLLALLDLRNGCAHPTQVTPQIHAMKAFFEQALEYVLTK